MKMKKSGCIRSSWLARLPKEGIASGVARLEVGVREGKGRLSFSLAPGSSRMPELWWLNIYAPVHQRVDLNVWVHIFALNIIALLARCDLRRFFQVEWTFLVRSCQSGSSLLAFPVVLLEDL